jgi:hypothetical protein
MNTKKTPPPLLPKLPILESIKNLNKRALKLPAVTNLTSIMTEFISAVNLIDPQLLNPVTNSARVEIFSQKRVSDVTKKQKTRFFDLSDEPEYVVQLIKTSIRSLLTPIIFLTDWVEKSTYSRIRRDFFSLLYSVVNQYREGTLLKNLKELSTQSLNPSKNWKAIVKKFFSGSLYKSLKLQYFNFMLDNQSKKCKSSKTFFYSMVHFKLGLSRLPNVNIYQNVNNSAEILTNRSELGIIHRPKFFLELATQYVIQNFSESNPYHDDEIKRVLPMGATLTHGHGEFSDQYTDVSSKLPFSELGSSYDEMISNLKDPKSIKSNFARVAVLDEALKNRFLTINSVPFQIGTRTLQDYLLKAWDSSKFSTFKDGSIEKFNDFLSSKGTLDGSSYAVDYSAATDYLDPRTTKYVLDLILHILQIPKEFHPFYLQAVSGKQVTFEKFLHVTNYPSKSLKRAIQYRFRNGFRQSNGQMMGNTLSFPILCIINLASFLYASYKDDPHLDGLYKIWLNNQTNGIKLLPLKKVNLILNSRKGIDEMLINGDDSVKVNGVNTQFCENHKEICRIFHLVLNMNKTIITFSGKSGRFNINSRQFEIDVPNQNIWEVGFLNQRLLYNWNIKLSMSGESTAVTENVITQSKRFLEQLQLKTLEEEKFYFSVYSKFNMDRILSFKESKYVKSQLLYLSTQVGGGDLYNPFDDTPPFLFEKDLLIIKKFMEGQFSVSKSKTMNRRALLHLASDEVYKLHSRLMREVQTQIVKYLINLGLIVLWPGNPDYVLDSMSLNVLSYEEAISSLSTFFSSEIMTVNFFKSLSIKDLIEELGDINDTYFSTHKQKVYLEDLKDFNENFFFQSENCGWFVTKNEDLEVVNSNLNLKHIVDFLFGIKNE